MGKWEVGEKGEGRINRDCGKKFVGGVRQGAGGSPDEKIFTHTDERGFLPYTPHPTPSFKLGDGELGSAGA
ncbi:MAG: hypothetical protein ACKPKE_19585, partial [Microcystis panniformis]